MKKYSDYKNSSVPWIGEIPTTWNLSQLRYVIHAAGYPAPGYVSRAERMWLCPHTVG